MSLSGLAVHYPLLLHYKYLLLLVVGTLEGFNVFIIAGFLISIGTLAFVPAFFICLVGELINSYFWYFVGYYGGAKPIDFFVRKSQKKRALVEKIRTYMHQHTAKVLVLVKLTYSVTVATLILIGSIKYSLKKFSFYNFFSSIGWVIITFGIGYFFGRGYQLYVTYFQNVSYIILFIAAVIAIVYIGERVSQAAFSQLMQISETLYVVGNKARDWLDTLFFEDRRK